MTYGDENPGPGLGWAQTCGGVKTVNEIPIPPVLDNWISNSNTDIKKTKYLQIDCHPKRPRHKINLKMNT